MATSAGKSTSSIAALGLVVVMAAMMASSANAALAVKNGYTAPISLILHAHAPLLPPIDLTVVVDAGATVVDALPNLVGGLVGGILKLVEIKIGAKLYVVPLDLITKLTGTLGLLTKLTVTGDAAHCGKGLISVLVTAIVNGEVVTATICIKL